MHQVPVLAQIAHHGLGVEVEAAHPALAAHHPPQGLDGVYAEAVQRVAGTGAGHDGTEPTDAQHRGGCRTDHTQAATVLPGVGRGLGAGAILPLVLTVTGDIHVIDTAHFAVMKSGAMVANSGHFNVEINLPGLETMSTSHRKVRDFVDEYVMADGRKIFVLGEGRLINLAAGDGHPASVMDMSFANQALSAEYMVKQAKNLNAHVYDVPEDIDREVARLKLHALGVSIDVLTPEQERYLGSWEEGT